MTPRATSPNGYAKKAQSNFDAAWYDSLARGVRGEADVKCRVEKTGTGYKVVAEGERGDVHRVRGRKSIIVPPPERPLTLTAQTSDSLSEDMARGKETRRRGATTPKTATSSSLHGTAAQMPLYRAFEEVLQEAKKR